MKTPGHQTTLRLFSIVLLFSTAAGCAPKPPKHGTTFVLGQRVEENVPVRDAWLADSQAALTRRLGAMGVKSSWEPARENRLQVSVADDSDLDAVRSALTRRGRLSFRFVHPKNDELVHKGESAAGFDLMEIKTNKRDRSQVTEQMLVEQAEEPALGIGAIKNAMVTRDQSGNPEISFELTPRGSTAFARMTRDNIGRRLAIVVDGKLYSAPMIMGEIPGGRGMISGSFSVKEAMELATALDSALPVDLAIVTEKKF